VGCGVWDLLARGNTKPSFSNDGIKLPSIRFSFLFSIVVYFENMKMPAGHDKDKNKEFGCSIGNAPLYTCNIPMAVKIQHQQQVLYIVSASFTSY
jgi:hypothetical protein